MSRHIPDNPYSPPTGSLRLWVLANPNAGRGRGGLVANAACNALAEVGHQVERADERPSLAMPSGRPDRVLLIGGDGTLREGVQRLLELFPGPEAAPPVLPVPMGTANLVGQYLGVPRTLLDIGLDNARAVAAEVAANVTGRKLPTFQVGPLRLDTARLARRWIVSPERAARQVAERVVRAIERDERSLLDVGLANDRVFLLMAGVGFDAHVVHSMDARRRGPIGLLSYALPAASAVARYGFPPVRVEVDGRRVFGPKPAVVMVANLPQYGIGFPLVPDARGDDGLLDVLALPCSSRVELGKLLALAADGQHLQASGVVRVRGHEVVVLGDAHVPVQVDGDPGGHLPLRASLMGRQVPFITPVT